MTDIQTQLLVEDPDSELYLFIDTDGISTCVDPRLLAVLWSEWKHHWIVRLNEKFRRVTLVFQ